MATVGVKYMTLSDLKGRIDPSGKLDSIIEAAANVNHFIQDALMMEGNESAGNKATIRTGYPGGTWRKLYGGVVEERSTTKQVTDTVGLLEGYSTVDEHLVEIAPDGMAFRAGEDGAFLEGLTQTLEDKFWYGNTDTDPEQIMGMAPRYAHLTVANAATAANVIEHSTDRIANAQTSIWLISWDPRIVFTFFGKGTRGGFQVDDKGKQTVYDSNNDPYEAWRTHFKWQIGLALLDWRYCARICNIDVAERDGSTPKAFKNNLIRLLRKRPNRKGRPVMYMNNATLTAIDIERTETANNNMALTLRDWMGEPTMHLWDVPIRLSDAILDTEAVVPA